MFYALNAVTSPPRRLGEQCHSETSFYSQKLANKSRLHSVKHLHSIQGVSLWFPPMHPICFRRCSRCPNKEGNLRKLSKVSRERLFSSGLRGQQTEHKRNRPLKHPLEKSTALCWVEKEWAETFFLIHALYHGADPQWEASLLLLLCWTYCHGWHNPTFSQSF